jgi:hypothetical protein
MSHDSFRDWFKANLLDSAADIASHGADAGYSHLTYIRDCAETFDLFASEIWEMAVQDAEEMGCKNVAELISGFSRADMLCNFDQFKNLMLWYAAEKVAREIVDAGEVSEN